MSHPEYRIELARPDDISHLPAIERAAGRLFASSDVGETALLNDETSLEQLRHAQQAGHLWVARDTRSELVGFGFVEIVDGQPHLEEIDVHPAHGRRGIGRALVEAICSWARAAGYTYLTLTTFRDVAWNAPFYAKAGFRILAREGVTAGVEAIVCDEASRGLDPARRVVMRRELRADG
jgi:GNAT superfamily N-acetyltransferase